MEKAYSYSCAFDPDMHNKFSVEFCTSDKEMYLKVKNVIDMLLSGDLNVDITTEYDDDKFIVER